VAIRLKPKKLTAAEKRELKALARKALFLFKAVVKARAGKRCEVSSCKKTKRLQVHHIESFAMNRGLRYEPRNGILLCTSHHKFGRVSAHKSFFFMNDLLRNNLEHDRWDFLIAHYLDEVEITIPYLKEQIARLERLIGV